MRDDRIDEGSPTVYYLGCGHVAHSGHPFSCLLDQPTRNTSVTLVDHRYAHPARSWAYSRGISPWCTFLTFPLLDRNSVQHSEMLITVFLILEVDTGGER